MFNSSGATNYSYDRSCRIKTISYPNNTSAHYSNYAAVRTADIHNTQNVATVSCYTYSYDDKGNRTEQRETSGGNEEVIPILI